MRFKHVPTLTPRAKELRKNMTPEERHLWYDFLRFHPVRFLRQKVIDGYIIDFYCASARLAVELDGTQHNAPEYREYDAERERCLNGWGIEVIRFSNREIHSKFSNVCRKIDETVQERMKQTDWK